MTADWVLVHNEYDVDPNSNNMDDIIGQIPSQYKKLGECDGFASALRAILDKFGIPYKIVRVDSDFSIYSDKAGKMIGKKI